jgi:dihydroorotate dehydrogenase
MWLDEDAPIRKRDLILAHPFLNAPGMLGFAPDAQTMPFLEHLGAFMTNPISRHFRKPAENRCCLAFPGGFLLHTGWPNPGIRRAISRNRRAWADASLPVIVHLLGENPETTAEMVWKLEGLENILALEIGLPPNCSAALLNNFLDASEGELPIIVSLDPQQLSALLDTLLERQPVAVHLQPPRGTLPDEAGNLVGGQLYGPATFPLTLQAVQRLVKTDLRVLAGGGAFNRQQMQILLDAGISALSLDAALWGITSSALFD